MAPVVIAILFIAAVLAVLVLAGIVATLWETYEQRDARVRNMARRLR